MSSNYLKLVMLGEGRVGKTSLTLRYCQGEFSDSQESTIVATYLEKNILLDTDEQVKVAIWDTAGQEKFNAIAPMYYRDALGAVIVYDITFRESLDKVQKWVTELQQFADKNIVVCIAGNKCDMENQRQIKKEEAEHLAKQLGAVHFDTSAKANVGIDDMFKFLAKQIVEKQKSKQGLSKKGPNARNKKKKLTVGGKIVEVKKDDIMKKQEVHSDDEGQGQQSQLKNQSQQRKSVQKKQAVDSDDDDDVYQPPKNESKSHKLKSSSKSSKDKKKKDGCC